jgi:hypothetical protein
MTQKIIPTAIHDFDPSKGMAFQGDISIIPIPKYIKIDRSDEIAPINGRLILQEGEVSGHHHAITLLEHPDDHVTPVKTSKAVQDLMADAQAGKIAVPTAKMFRDPAAVEAMRRTGIITRVDLVVGVLVVETGPMCLSHEEHDTIRISSGAYLIGRQVESAGAEERVITD